MRSRLWIPFVLTGLLTSVFVAAAPVAQSAKLTGAATPQEAVAGMKKAIAANDVLGALPFISPGGLKQLAGEGVTGLLMALAFSNPDDPMPGSAKLPKAELDAKRKGYKEAHDLVTSIFKPYGLDTTIGKPVLAPETQKSIDGALAKADNLALVGSLYSALTKIGPLLGMKGDAKPGSPVELGAVTGYKITGDKATAQNGAETIDFVRVAGRWYLEPPASKNGGASSAPASNQSSGQRAAAPPASAAGKDPEIVAGGVQIARVVVPNDDFSSKPFHTDNGTTLVLWVKMPAGQGLIEIDEDKSLLQSYTDDKGTNLGGKFGSFPQEFNDGTGGIIDITSSGMPAKTATALLAEGSVTMTVAAGTRKTRAANVRLQNDAKFMFGQTSITVAEVATDGDSQTFTIKLPRQIMTGIKDVLFFDAAGKPIEGRRTSRGYMNDAGEMGFTVKTAAKSLTLEFEAWQGVRTIKVPFKVKAGVGLQ